MIDYLTFDLIFAVIVFGFHFLGVIKIELPEGLKEFLAYL